MQRCLAHRQTLEWLERLVIGKGLCPFAAPPHQAQEIRISVQHEAKSDAEALQAVQSEMELLLNVDGTTENHPDLGSRVPTTTLVVFPNHFVEHFQLVRASYDV